MLIRFFYFSCGEYKNEPLKQFRTYFLLEHSSVPRPSPIRAEKLWGPRWSAAGEF
jgi:hypothetical protein